MQITKHHTTNDACQQCEQQIQFIKTTNDASQQGERTSKPKIIACHLSIINNQITIFVNDE